MKAAWLTDIHLNFIRSTQLEAFCIRVVESKPDVVLISGDIGEAPDLHTHLLKLEHLIDKPIYFVLGNHDFYHGSIQQVRSNISAFCASSKQLHWLPDAGLVALTENCALIGHDGWADGRFGDWDASPILLNDFILIKEFSGLPRRERLKMVQSLTDTAVRHFETLLPIALETCTHIFVVTHVPPFKEACLYNGAISNDDWLPHFSSKAVGDVLLSHMSKHPGKQMTVLCGHTHGGGHVRIAHNLEVYVGAAEYKSPAVQKVFDIF